MIRLRLSIDLRYDIASQPGDFIFNIHAAQTAHQRLVVEELKIIPPAAAVVFSDAAEGSRYMRLRAGPGTLGVHYSATVDLVHHVASPVSIGETPVAELPAAVLQYIYPSRYCQSDRLRRFASREFGQLNQGYWRVQAICDWVHQRTVFATGSSNVNTSALDTLTEQIGVCRDFAHLMIALCRAVNIPARFVTGIDYGADPILGPTDFHAYVEVFMSGRWYLFDPTGISPPMGLVRIGTGRDAADVSFATIFGPVTSSAPVIDIAAVNDPANGFVQPWHCTDALSSTAAA
jgi:transglutaminase-like putative cysteine protease